MNNKVIQILDIPFTTLYTEEILDLIKESFQKSKQQVFLATPNPEMLLESQKNSQFKKILQQTTLNLPDGNGLIWANLFLEKTKSHTNKLAILAIGASSLIAFLWHKKSTHKRFNQAIHGSDFTLKILSTPELSSRAIFLLGNQDGLTRNPAQSAAAKLQKNNTKLNIVGAIDSIPTEKKLIQQINQSQAEILFVGFGAPHQEIWLAQNLPHLKTIKLAIGIGGTFDFINGTLPRAPLLMRKISLEWLYRLYKQPKRLKRIINATLVFPYTIIKARMNQAPPGKSS